MPVALTLPHLTAAAAAAVWLATVVWRRKSLSRERMIFAGIGIVLLVLFAAGVFAHLPKPEKILEDLAGALGKWTYLFVGILAFLETGAFIGLIAPGEAAVIVGGVVAGQGEIDIRLLIGIVWFAAYMGDTASYLLGARLGRGFLERHGPKVQITEERLKQVEKYMAVHGGKTILIGRFIGLVRALAPFIAGASRMPYRRFMPYDVLGSGLWAAAFCMLGYVFAQNLSAVINYAERGVLIFGWTVGTIVLIVYLVRRFRDPEEREKLTAWLDEQERNPRRRRIVRPIRAGWNRIALPIGRLVAPRARFALDRLTPGGLGIEFTTVAAILAVAGYGFYFFLVAALDWPSSVFVNELNSAAFRIADSIRTDALDDVASFITDLGRLYVVAAVVLVASAICFYRRRIPEGLVLIGSLALSVAIVQATKSWTDVPRPPHPLTGTDGSAFPSGHSAYAVSYVVVALTLERVGGIFGRVALVTTAVILGGAIALSRVYLRAHYLSDAIGGTAVGFLSASLVVAVVLIVRYVRERHRRRDAEPPLAGRVADSV
jgi:undecaprenyl-diphosphatase